jgi:hypothetical protein
MRKYAPLFREGQWKETLKENSFLIFVIILWISAFVSVTFREPNTSRCEIAPSYCEDVYEEYYYHYEPRG